jgi:serine protease Do
MTHRAVAASAVLLLAGCAAPGRVAPVRTGQIALNSEVTGVLERGDARLNDGSVYQAWRFFGTQGQPVRIDVISGAFDAFVILEGPAGDEVARNDDGGDGTDARLSVTLPVTGDYRIIANTYRQGQFGRYVLRLTGGPPPAPMGGGGMVMSGTVGQILRGQIVSGRLGPNDARLADNSLYQAWTHFGQAGETITLDVMSSDFDAYAVIQDASGNVLTRDDDSGEGQNARVAFTLPYTGMYRLIANTFRPNATGAYTLAVR